MDRLTKNNDTQYDFVGRYDTNIKEFSNNKELRVSVMNKLGQLEDIEERIGCPLDVFFKVFKKGIYVRNETTNHKLEFWYPQEIKVIDAGLQWDICKINNKANKYVGCFNYKKTWALTREELENG